MENQGRWEYLYKNIYGNGKEINKDILIKEDSLLQNIFNEITLNKGNKPYKDDIFLEKIGKSIDEEVLKEFIKKINSNINKFKQANNELYERQIYTINRVFIEISKIKGLSNVIINDKHYFNDSAFGTKQKILELALNEGTYIDQKNKNISHLNNILKDISEKEQKTKFQEKLIKLNEENNLNN